MFKIKISNFILVTLIVSSQSLLFSQENTDSSIPLNLQTGILKILSHSDIYFIGIGRAKAFPQGIYDAMPFIPASEVGGIIQGGWGMQVGFGKVIYSLDVYGYGLSAQIGKPTNLDNQLLSKSFEIKGGLGYTVWSAGSFRALPLLGFGVGTMNFVGSSKDYLSFSAEVEGQYVLTLGARMDKNNSKVLTGENFLVTARIGYSKYTFPVILPGAVFYDCLSLRISCGLGIFYELIEDANNIGQ